MTVYTESQLERIRMSFLRYGIDATKAAIRGQLMCVAGQIEIPGEEEFVFSGEPPFVEGCLVEPKVMTAAHADFDNPNNRFFQRLYFGKPEPKSIPGRRFSGTDCIVFSTSNTLLPPVGGIKRIVLWQGVNLDTVLPWLEAQLGRFYLRRTAG